MSAGTVALAESVRALQKDLNICHFHMWHAHGLDIKKMIKKIFKEEKKTDGKQKLFLFLWFPVCLSSDWDLRRPISIVVCSSPPASLLPSCEELCAGDAKVAQTH